MPAPRSTPSGSGSRGEERPAGGEESGTGRTSPPPPPTPEANPAGEGEGPGSGQRIVGGLANLAEHVGHTMVKPLDAVVLTRERIQETLEEAAARGRLSRKDANELVAELFSRGRQQTDDLLGELLERGRGGLESARGGLESAGGRLGAAARRARRSEPADRLAQGDECARESVAAGPSFPIEGYDELTAAQVKQRLAGLKPAELRRVRSYEQRHANRKSVLDAVEKALA